MQKLLSFLTCLGICISLSVNVAAADFPQTLGLQSQTAVLMDAQTGQVLYDKNKDTRMYPASITKILTGALAIQNGNLSDVVTASYEAVHSLPRGTSHIALDTGEQITLEQALYGLAIESANDAANVIAENIGGTAEQFSFLMNDYARQLGAVESHFANPHGLPDSNHYTTAYDMGLITAAALKTPGFSEIFSTRRYDVPPTNIKPETRQFWNANYFINHRMECQGIVMSKTGWTQESGNTLVTAAEREGKTLIAVVMNSTRAIDVYNDTLALLDYGFSNFEAATVTSQMLTASLPKQVAGIEGTEILLEPLNALGDEIQVLMPKGADPQGISVVYGEGKPDESGRCANIKATVQYTQGETVMTLGTTNVTAIVQEPVVAETLSQKLFAFAKKPTFVILNGLMWVVFGFLAWLVIRRMIILERRKRRRRRKMKKKQNEARRRAAQPTQKREQLTPQQQQNIQAERLRRQIYRDS
ncbi:MAG: D-alanyl-D-alanine carboxypeptidase family protein [Oscillospiraceae bacterium]